MGGNKHKNGIVCTFPGCSKTMRTQKFKLHFSKQHLKPGELYTVEHRRRFEVARDDDGSCSPAPSFASPVAAAPAVGAAAVDVKEAVLVVAAPMPPAAFHASLAPQFAPLAADSAAASSSEEALSSSTSSNISSTSSSTSTSSRAVEEPAEPLPLQVSAALTRSSVLRFGGSTASAVVGVKRPAPERILAPEATSATSPSEQTSVDPIPSSAVAESAAATVAEPQDVPSAVLAQFIGMLDVRFRELIQKMDQVIDGQHEIAELLRRPLSAESAQLGMEPPSSLSPGSAKKRRRGGGAGSEHEVTGATSFL